MTITTSGFPEPNKKQIIERLFMAGHITFNEMWTLLLDEPQVKYVPMLQSDPPYQPPINPNPYPYPEWTISTSNDLSNERLHQPSGRAGDSISH